MQHIKVGIVGGTGYSGVELLRLLAQHPHAEIAVITSRGESGQLVSDLFPSLRGHVDLPFTDPATANLKSCDVVFFATPNGVAMQQARELYDAGVRIVDLAADFRIRDVPTWEQWYGMKHACPELVAAAVYGLPEMNREQIRVARVLANPGCYPTAVQLGFMPLLRAGVVDTHSLIADAKSGVSGAGRKAETHILFSEAADNFKAYGVSGHRHLPEISQGLAVMCGKPVGLTFVPHLTPMIRGIHATLYASLEGESDIQALFEEAYLDEAFVDVLPAGAHPETRSVRGSNLCRIAVHRPQGGNMVVVLSVIDNLVKGAAGQAVQNMNIMFGLAETAGLGASPSFAMKQLLRALKSHFGITAPHMAVHTEIGWYWRILGVAALLGIGYGIGYWRFVGSNANLLAEELQRLQSVNQSLQAKMVFAERQMQVEHAAQTNLAQEMTALQDEDMRLKEDVAFYKSILVEGAGAGILKIHSMKVAKGGHPGDYQYNILLVQTGKHDKMVQGSLQLVLNGMQSGTHVVLTVSEGQAPLKGVKVSFKYYQRIEGAFSIPSQLSAQTLQARFFEQGSAQPKLTQSVNLPG